MMTHVTGGAIVIRLQLKAMFRWAWAESCGLILEARRRLTEMRARGNRWYQR